jgi:hypothetical protein
MALATPHVFSHHDAIDMTSRFVAVLLKLWPCGGAACG